MEQSGEIRLLGSVTIGDQPVTSAYERTLLAVLSVSAGRRVETDALVDALWDSSLPVKPRNAVQVHASRLRKLLAPAFGDCLINERHGYRLEIDPASIDLHRFHLADDRDPEAVTAALGEWRGEPFGGCASGARLEAERVRAHERRLRLQVRGGESVLDAGDTDRAVELLAPLREEHPEHEHVAHLMMTALYRAGRQTDALAVFEAIRRHLADEFGLDPARELVALQRRLLDHDRALAVPIAEDAATEQTVGREPEIASLVARIGGPGAIVVVSGEAGIGKSVVLRAVVAAARADGALVGQGSWDEAGNPLTGWREALGPLGLGLLAGQGPLVHGGLEEAAARRPVVLALDDVHLADSASLGVLRHLARLGPPSGVLVLAAVRSPDLTTHSEWVRAEAELRRRPCVEHLPLGIVPDEAVAEIARSVLRTRPRLSAAGVERLVVHVVGAVEGHPLHLTTLLGLLDDPRDDDEAVALLAGAPRALRVLLDQHLAALPPTCRRAVEALAVLEPVRLADLADVLGLPPVQVAADLDEGVRVGLVESVPTFCLRHALLRAALCDGVSPGLAAALHQARLDRLDEAADAFTRLRHAVGAAPLIPPAQLADARRVAGLVAYRRGALVEALTLFDEVGDSLGPRALAEVALHRGLVLAATGRAAEADDLLDAVVASQVSRGADPDLAVLAAVGDQRLGPAAAGDARRLARLRHAGSLVVGRVDRLDLVAATLAEEARVEGRIRPETAAELDTLLAAARDDDDPGVISRVRHAEALRLVDAPVPAARRLDAALAARVAAVRTGDPLAVLGAEELVLGAALAAGETSRVRALADGLEREGRRWHRPRSRWAAMLVRAATAQAEGEDDHAEAAADEAQEYGVTRGLPDALAARLVHRLARHLLTGTLPELEGIIAQVATAYPHVPGWTAALAAAAAQGGDLDEARRLLDTFRERRHEVGGGSVDRAGLCLAAVAAHSCGDRDSALLVRGALPAEPTAVVVVGVGAAVFGPVTWATGLAAAAVDDTSTAVLELDIARRVSAERGWKAWERAAREAIDVIACR